MVYALSFLSLIGRIPCAEGRRIVAAIKLVKLGYEVTLFEKENEDSISYDWSDDIMLEVFEKTGIPCPPSECFEPKKQWRFVSPDFNSNIVGTVSY